MKILIAALVFFGVMFSATMLIPSGVEPVDEQLTPRAEKLIRDRMKTVGVNTGGFAYSKEATDFILRNGSLDTSATAH